MVYLLQNMMAKTRFTKGEKVFFIQNAIYIKEAEVINTAAGFVTVKILSTGGGLRARENRFFKTKEEAEHFMRNSNAKRGE